MYAENKVRDRRHTEQYRQGKKAPKDVVLSAMLIQISLCIVLLTAAYILKSFGAAVYEPVRAEVKKNLESEFNFSSAKDVLTNLNIELPSNINAELSKFSDYFAKKTQLEDRTDNIIKEELNSQEKMQLPFPSDMQFKEQNIGQGGGFNFIKDEKRLKAPKTVVLSPFFISDKPILPVKAGTFTSRFGYRKHPLTGEDDFHTGIDIAAPEGTPISAVLDGIVSETGSSESYGNYIIISHSAGLETVYCHCSKILVPIGTKVIQRETIAKVGNTGASTGSHVHLEIRINGLQANPAWVYNEF
ncbi:MAG: M23 family metallopeptidase [Hydrogenoanaerobacterium sp.]